MSTRSARYASAQEICHIKWDLLKVSEYLLKEELVTLAKIVSLPYVSANWDVFYNEMNVDGLLVALHETKSDEDCLEFMNNLEELYALLPKQDLYARVNVYVVGSTQFIHPLTITSSYELDELLATLKPYWDDGTLFGMWMENHDKSVGTEITRWGNEGESWEAIIKPTHHRTFKTDFMFTPNK